VEEQGVKRYCVSWILKIRRNRIRGYAKGNQLLLSRDIPYRDIACCSITYLTLPVWPGPPAWPA